MFETKEELKKFLEKKKFQKRLDKLAKKYKDQRVMMYGTGMGFEAVKENYDLGKLNIIGVADMKFEEGQEFMGYKTYEPDTFMKEKPDVVLIGMVEHDIAEDYFAEEIMPEYGKFKYEPLIKLSVWDLLKKLFS